MFSVRPQYVFSVVDQKFQQNPRMLSFDASRLQIYLGPAKFHSCCSCVNHMFGSLNECMIALNDNNIKFVQI